VVAIGSVARSKLAIRGVNLTVFYSHVLLSYIYRSPQNGNFKRCEKYHFLCTSGDSYFKSHFGILIREGALSSSDFENEFYRNMNLLKPTGYVMHQPV